MSLYTDASLIMYPSGYKEDKIYSLKPTDGSGDLTFTRASTATRVNAEGLIETSPVNLVQYSEEFDNAAWTKSNASISANATTAPNGTATADKLIENTVNNNHYAAQNVTAENIAYTYSLYVKADTRTRVRVQMSDLTTGDIRLDYNFTTDTSVLNGSGSRGSWSSSSFTKTDILGGWVRISISGIKGAGSVASCSVFLLDNSGNSSYTGNGTSGLFIYGAQLNQGATAKTYFPTTDRLNVPRIDYTGGGCGSLLLEKQSTNLVTYSSEFSNAYWTKSGASVTSGFTSPDGTANAFKLVEDSSLSSHYAAVGNIFTADGSLRAWSLFVKEGERRYIFITNVNTINNDINCVVFDTRNGVFTNTNDPTYIVTRNVQALENGWYRIDFTSAVNSAAYDNFFIGISSTSNMSGVSYQGDGTSGVYIYGAQLENGSYSTSLINTSGTAVTRLADSASKTGISSLIGQTQGTLFCDFNVLPSTLAGSYYVETFLNDGTSNNKVALTYYADGRIQFVAFASGSLVVNIDLPSYGLTVGKHKFAFAYKLNDYVAYADGALVGTDTSATVPSMSALNLYDTIGGTHAINQAIVFPTRLSNAELATLTTL